MTPVRVAPPLLETKLRPPDRRPGLVPRRDLVRRLDAGLGSRLTLVCAPAGWGKTTLVGEWIAARGGEEAGWVAIDPSDNDPARFWSYVAEALRRAGAPVDEAAAAALAAPGGVAEAGLAALVNAAAALPGRAVLALDDYHLIVEPAIHERLAFLIARLPDALRLVIASRSDPPVGLARLRARGELAEIRADDLRFSDAEAGALLTGAIGATLEDAEIGRLRRRTEGWAAGLYLAGLSLRGRPDPRGFIRDFAGDDRLVVDYLASEVLEGLPEERRRFLLRTSVLARLSGPLCDAVTGGRDSARVLQELERSNLFLVPLDSRREWYRYHHLFGELLRHELALTAPDEAPELHRRAAEWLLSQGDVDEAIRHSAAAGDLGRAADLIAEHWAGFQRAGWTVTIQAWLSMLPEDAVRRDARLCVASALAHISLGRPEEAGRWLDAAEAAALGTADQGPVPIEAQIAVGRSIERVLSGDAGAALGPGRRAVELVTDPVSWWRAAAALALGLALYAVDQREEACAALEEAVHVGRRVGAWAPALVALSHLAREDLERGDVDAAERRAREAIELAEEERHAEFPHAVGAHAVLALVLSSRGDHRAARAEAARAAELARRGRAPAEIAFSLLVRGEVALAAGDAEAAGGYARDARAVLSSVPDPGYQGARLLALEDAVRRAAPAAAEGAAEALTDRELEVLRLLAGTASAREIAGHLYVSHNTVKTQVRSIYRKLGVASRSQAVSRARQLGLLTRAGGAA